MPTRADLDLIRGANDGLVVLAERDLRDLWRSLDMGRPEAARDALLEAFPAVTFRYGAAAATIAADWYDDLRFTEGVQGRFAAEMADPVAPEYVRSRVRYGAAHLFTDTPDQMLAFLSGALVKYTLQPGRDTIAQSAAADPQARGWHRETRPSATYTSGCDFCRFLAHRGAVYRRGTAAFAAHDDCKCIAVPSWDAGAPEVPAAVYEASKRMDLLRRQAAGEPVTLSTRRRRRLERRGITAQQDAQRQLEQHRERTRHAIDIFVEGD